MSAETTKLRNLEAAICETMSLIEASIMAVSGVTEEEDRLALQAVLGAAKAKSNEAYGLWSEVAKMERS
jgi:hypothetical protein